MLNNVFNIIFPGLQGNKKRGVTSDHAPFRRRSRPRATSQEAPLEMVFYSDVLGDCMSSCYPRDLRWPVSDVSLHSRQAATLLFDVWDPTQTQLLFS